MRGARRAPLSMTDDEANAEVDADADDHELRASLPLAKPPAPPLPLTVLALLPLILPPAPWYWNAVLSSVVASAGDALRHSDVEWRARAV